jgi:hypothetical protein
MKYVIMIEIPESVKFDPKNKPFSYSVMEHNEEVVLTRIDINGNCDTAKHAFDEAYQRLNEYLLG